MHPCVAPVILPVVSLTWSLVRSTVVSVFVDWASTNAGAATSAAKVTPNIHVCRIMSSPTGYCSCPTVGRRRFLLPLPSGMCRLDASGGVICGGVGPRYVLQTTVRGPFALSQQLPKDIANGNRDEERLHRVLLDKAA